MACTSTQVPSTANKGMTCRAHLIFSPISFDRSRAYKPTVSSLSAMRTHSLVIAVLPLMLYGNCPTLDQTYRRRQPHPTTAAATANKARLNPPIRIIDPYQAASISVLPFPAREPGENRKEENVVKETKQNWYAYEKFRQSQLGRYVPVTRRGHCNNTEIRASPSVRLVEKASAFRRDM